MDEGGGAVEVVLMLVEALVPVLVNNQLIAEPNGSLYPTF
jgi:hypothetical protein